MVFRDAPIIEGGLWFSTMHQSSRVVYDFIGWLIESSHRLEHTPFVGYSVDEDE